MSEQKTILVVEDNQQLNDINCRALRMEGHATLSALTLERARHYLATASPDAIVLDIMLPDGNGVDFCREIREQTAAPILFLTAVKGYEETMEGLAAGGDDYLNKPFDIPMLIAKISAFLRRDDLVRREQTPSLVRGALNLDAVVARAYLNDVDLLLTHKEFSLLFMLMQNEGAFFQQEALYQAVWKLPMEEDNQALKAAVSRLRRKLEGSGYTINSRRGAGYQFAEI